MSSYESGVRGPEHKHINVDERPPPQHSTGFVDSDLPCGQTYTALSGQAAYLTFTHYRAAVTSGQVALIWRRC